MRRCAARLAAAAAAAGGGSDLQTVSSSLGSVAKSSVTGTTTEYKHVHTATRSPSDFIPPATEAPERLQSYVEPKPFISLRRMQVFTVSLGVGAASVALVYFFLSTSIRNRVEEEQFQVDRIVERNRMAMQDRISIVPIFVAPSTYDELYAKMVKKDKEVETQLTQAKSTLHTETMFHVKMWWNRCLHNIQSATDAFAAAQLRHKEAQAEANIKATLQYSGYELVGLSKVGA
ncbi:protein of unknown function - conserved [Leishmania donovani]|uniref:Uncharacterized protein n=3 Tax=Leishmania donovani species complex TaxID=38574 RepID=A4IBZ1_LEIIN|nr:conserved hypothetical protein [Leishmania infantum JPCM5]XP_003865035.1 hypothetical protein, conserved [Leishmania donovani]CAC9546956.1 hypothetical_protein_-_conserved [Leishmania infantum]AYU83258.1 hypothetical protein LdCL_350050900 [Leishmania donovani]CAJ1993269.1 protein of unknown function - conserved [Leishmania donovani]CAM72363.1 conserved hypothetical protein [Leishmania infantum JPCM5]CBZ38356.1 hypothetical protein, conserved [Leishmania donovani]|eukprot:XP_001469260.1 conserved hypothetical protein [Leishmania infantum JPCM5]